MKNFSTATLSAPSGLSFRFSILFSVLLFALSISTARADVPVPAVSVPAADCAFLPNAPDQHVVVRGDTLWDISAKFLQHPWCWPTVWGLNREQIQNPHWIYPGQIVLFDRVAKRLRLAGQSDMHPAPQNQPSPTTRLAPRIRAHALDGLAIPTIHAERLAPFLVRPLIVTETELAQAPVIMASADERVFLSHHDVAYVRGELKDKQHFQVLRPGKALRDPDTHAVLGYEAVYLGVVKLDRAAQKKDEAHRFIVSETQEEMQVGDRLVPLQPIQSLHAAPHLPARQVSARIVSIYGGGTQAGQDQVVSINRGAIEGIDEGSVLKLQHADKIVRDRTDHGHPVRLPDDRYGNLLIFRVFEHLAYGLIMQVTDVVAIGDNARSPE